MNKWLSVLLAAIVLGGLTSCGEKKKSDVIIAPKPQAPQPKKTQKMSGYEQAREVEWLGSTYQVIVKREADTTLPLAVGDDNTKYYDNKITVRILRKDGSEFFNRTFLKTDFHAYLDKQTSDEGALLGLVYVEASGDYLNFAASVGSPDVTSDEYVPLKVKISRMGAVSIGKDSQLDTGSDEASDDASDEEDDE